MKTKFHYFFLCMSFITVRSFCQPNIDWRYNSFIETGPDGVWHDNRHNSQDWWYSISSGYTNPVTKTGFEGYAVVGYSNFKNYNGSSISYPDYDETLPSHPGYTSYGPGCFSLYMNPNDVDCQNFINPTIGSLGPTFSTFGFIDEYGETEWHGILNAGAAMNKVIQLSNGEFLCFGGTGSTRKKTAAPEYGSPLYYNPTSAHPNDYFIYSDIYTGGLPATNQSEHIDIARFDMAGNIIFNNIYGPNDFNTSTGLSYQSGNSVISISAKQAAFICDGEGLGATELSNGNIVIVGFATDLNSYYFDGGGKRNYMRFPLALVISPTGEVISKKFLFQSGIQSSSSYYSGTGFAVKKTTVAGIEKIDIVIRKEYSNGSDEILVRQYTASTFENANSYILPDWETSVMPATVSPGMTCWDFDINNNGDIILPVIQNCIGCHSSGFNVGDLVVYRLNGTTGVRINPISGGVSVFLTEVQAYDLRFGITHLSAGGFGIVSTVLPLQWPNSGCTIGNIPSYMNVCGVYEWWNSDTYVAKIWEDGQIMWQKTFDTNDPVSCTDFPTGSDAGGNVKRQECMYGIAEDDEGGLAVCGNSSNNFDDNYVAKLFSDCEASVNFNINDPSHVYEITGPGGTPTTVTWSSSLKVLGMVVVKAGSKLVISGSNTVIEFADSRTFNFPTNITVEAGAVLEIKNGAKLTALGSCGDSRIWQGIEVQGNIGTRQQIVSGSDYAHGICLVNTGAVIEKAQVAIRNFVTNNGDGESINWYTVGGGIIQCNGAIFKNNKIDLRFITYSNTSSSGQPIKDLSYVQNTQFLTDAATAPHHFPPEAHVSMWNTRGINFTSNIFKNLTPTAYDQDQRGVGIVSYDASYDLLTPCSLYGSNGCATYGIPNVFENLYYGINAGASLPTASIRVSTNSFINNHRGIAVQGMDHVIISNNTFAIGDLYTKTFLPSTALLVSSPCGLFLNGCDAYTVQKNTFTNAVGSGNSLDFGIVDSYSNTNPNELRQNNFNNIATGIQPQENNDGLQLKCNEFTSNSILTADVKIVGLQTYGSIAAQQGACIGSDVTKLPGNKFSHTCSSAQDLAADYTVNNPILYNTRSLPSQELPQSGCYNTTSYQVNVCSGSGTGEACPSTNTGGGGANLAQLKQYLHESKSLVATLKSTLQKGDRPQLYTVINSGNELATRDSFLVTGPYFSDSVLLTFLRHRPVFSDGFIRQVMVACSPLSARVMDEFKNTPVNSATTNRVLAVQSGTSVRTSKELEFKYEKKMLVINYNYLISNLVNDRDNDARIDTLVEYLDFNIKPSSRAVLVGALIEKGLYEEAKDEVKAIENNDDLTTLLTNLITVRTASNTVESYTGTVAAEIDKLRNSIPYNIGVKGQALYNSLFHAPFNERIYLDTPSSNSARIGQEDIKDNTTLSDGIKIFPNPAANELFLMFDQEQTKSVKVSIYDINGRLVSNHEFNNGAQEQRLEINELSNGIYIYKIILDAQLVKTGKVVIMKD